LKNYTKLKKILILLIFLIPFNFCYATTNLDPNDPNFTGYPDGNSVFNAQCTTTDNYFYIYFSQTEGIAQSSAIQCQGENHWGSWQDFYDTYAGQGVMFLLEVPPDHPDCSSLTYSECIGTPPPPAPATTTQMFISGFTYGEALQVLLLLMIFILLFFSTLKTWIFGHRAEGTTKIKSDKNL
jgi:hypothetical protein